MPEKILETEIKKGHKPNLKWSDREANLRCDGKDRPFRTFEKIFNDRHLLEINEMQKDKLRDELIIKQTPKILQMEMAQKL